ncbi:hypothetical protein HD554DRAFT_1556687 [Boletus coccyginus]|nr:hypothetical protein HD554DRAFT_1556687 [Boletus coccyginus]
MLTRLDEHRTTQISSGSWNQLRSESCSRCGSGTNRSSDSKKEMALPYVVYSVSWPIVVYCLTSMCSTVDSMLSRISDHVSMTKSSHWNRFRWILLALLLLYYVSPMNSECPTE